MQTVKQPYELLVRFRDGSPVAAQVQWIYVTRDAQGREIAAAPAAPEPAGLAGSDFPIETALGAQLAAAFSATAPLLTQNATLRDQVEGLSAQLQEAQRALAVARGGA